jgi:hypothetical protein
MGKPRPVIFARIYAILGMIVNEAAFFMTSQSLDEIRGLELCEYEIKNDDSQVA